MYILTYFINLTSKNQPFNALHTKCLSNFAIKNGITMKEFILKYSGIAAIILGIMTFAIDYLCKLNSNVLLFWGLCMVLLGVSGQIWAMKH